MKVFIQNLHSMCENNTHFLSRAWRYVLLNGHTVVRRSNGADLVLVGGCAVTDTMRSRCEEIVLKSFAGNENATFVVFGCLAAFPDILATGSRAQAGRLVIIPYGESHILDDLIHARIPYERVTVNHLVGHVPYQECMGPADSYVHICQGCVNNCSYCTIKQVKGHVMSRPEDVIEAEVKALAQGGAKEVTLLGDDCGSYGLDDGIHERDNLPELLQHLSRAAPEMKFKVYNIFPALFLRYAPQLEPLFHECRISYLCLPVQSGSARILDLMNRNYDLDRLAEAIERMRKADPGTFFFSHFIFNFPTETWDDFMTSVSFARHFDGNIFIGYGDNKSTLASHLQKCAEGELKKKTRYLNEAVQKGQLKSFVVANP
jgi:threonylcarbamoyladenosine tRNA methylthiotransferase CDKAL1